MQLKISEIHDGKATLVFYFDSGDLSDLHIINAFILDFPDNHKRLDYQSGRLWIYNIPCCNN